MAHNGSKEHICESHSIKKIVVWSFQKNGRYRIPKRVIEWEPKRRMWRGLSLRKLILSRKE